MRYLLLIILLFLIHTSSYSQEFRFQKDIAVEIDSSRKIGFISKLIKVDEKYVLIDESVNRVYVLNDDFSIDYVFDHEACHPGSPFKPYNLTLINASTVLISSNPIFGYVFNPATRACSTDDVRRTRFMGGEYMTSAENGIVGVIHWRNKTMQFLFFGPKLDQGKSATIKDDLPFANMRSLITNEGKILYINNNILYLNEYDFTVMYLSESSIGSEEINRKIVPIPVKGFEKVSRDLNENAGGSMNPASMISPMIGKSIVRSMRGISDGYVLFEISDLKLKKMHTYICDDALKACSLLELDEMDGGLLYAGENEMVRVLAGDENPVLVRYVLVK